MKLIDGNLYFKNISKNIDQYEYLNKNINCDVLVVGAGVSGAITAYYMAEEGYDVVVIDKNIVGYGSTSSNVGILDIQLGMEISKLIKMVGEKKSKKCISLMLDSIEELNKITTKIEDKNNIKFKKCDSLYYTDKYMNKNNIVKEYNAKINCGVGTNFVTENNIIDLKYGLEIKDASATMNVYEFTKEIIRYISKKENVRVYEHTEACDIKSQEDYVKVVTNNKFNIKANKVIITEGAEVVKYFPEIPIELYKIYNIVTEPIENLKSYNANFTARNMESPFNYLRFTDDYRIVFGGQTTKVTEKELDDTISKGLANNRYRKLFRTLQETFYNIKDITVKYCFNGIYAETKDSLPIIDELPGMPNVYCNLSYGINGILFSIIGAKMLKEINREYYARDMHMFGIKR